MDRKVRKTDEKHAGRSTLLYELDLKAANIGHTHTHAQSEYSNPRAHARRALTISWEGHGLPRTISDVCIRERHRGQ